MTDYLTDVDESLKTIHENLKDQMPGKAGKLDKAAKAVAKRLRRMEKFVDMLESRCHELTEQGVMDDQAKTELKDTFEQGSGYQRLKDEERRRILKALQIDET